MSPDDRSGHSRRSPHARISGFVLLLCVAVLALSLFERSSTAGERTLADEIVEAYGGRSLLAGVDTLALEGRITTFVPPDSGTYSLKLKKGRKLLVDISYSARRERRVLNGEKGYSGDRGRASEVQGMAVAAMIYQYDQMDLPFGLADGTLSLRRIRQGTFRGKSVDIAAVAGPEGSTRMEATIDRARSRIVRTAASFGMGGGQAVLSAEFDDFRKVDGVLLPFLITNYAGDIKISETRVSSYVVNGNIDDSVFAP